MRDTIPVRSNRGPRRFAYRVGTFLISTSHPTIFKETATSVLASACRAPRHKTRFSMTLTSTIRGRRSSPLFSCRSPAQYSGTRANHEVITSTPATNRFPLLLTTASAATTTRLPSCAALRKTATPHKPPFHHRRGQARRIQRSLNRSSMRPAAHSHRRGISQRRRCCDRASAVSRWRH
jgi:hypothetical protein